MRNVFIIALILFSPYAVDKKSDGKKIIVNVCSLLPAAAIKKLLDPDKYTVKILKTPDYVTEKSACEAIWVGADIPVEGARKIITSAITAGIKLHYSWCRLG